jgi:hypothetical protein
MAKLDNILDELFSDTNELTCQYSASLSMVDPSPMAPTPLINLRYLIMHDVVAGLELLFDGIMLPCFYSLHALILSLFVAFARRANQMKTLDTVEQLVIKDQRDVAERYFSFKKWHDILPRLRTLLVQLHNSKCPLMAMADLFVDYIRRTSRSSLTLFSCCIDHYSDADNKEQFINYLEKRVENVLQTL